MKVASIALAAAAVLALPAAAGAQTQTDTQPLATTQNQPAAAMEREYRDIDDIRIIGANGNEIGEIEDVVLGPDGQLAYIVEFEEGFLGIRDREVVVPADRLQFDAQNRSFTSDMTEDEVKAMQEWDD